MLAVNVPEGRIVGWVEERMDVLETSSFLAISAGDLSAMKTSASSRRITAFHSVAISKTFLIRGPSLAGSVPKSSAWR